MKNESTQLIIDAEVAVSAIYKIGKNVIIYDEEKVTYPFFEILVNQLIENLQIKLGADYFSKDKKEQQILSTIQINIQKAKQNIITTDTLILEMEAVLNNSRVILFGFFEIPQLYGLVFNVFLELLIRYKVLINYGRKSKNQYRDFIRINSKETRELINTSKEISLKLKTIESEKTQEQNNAKNKDREIWMGRFSSICSSLNNNIGLKSENEEANSELSKVEYTSF